MAKDTFYFSHDYNARNDFKILFLRQQLGMEGYGIYWFLIESLAESGGRLPLKIIPVMAMQMQVTEVKVSAVINNFDLFEVSENEFFSTRLLNHLDKRKLLSEKGKKGAENRWVGNSHPNSHPNTDPNGHPISGANAKERKGKEIKEKESSSIEQHDTTQQVFGIESRKSYDSMPEEFKKMYSKILYDDYIRLMGNIKQECRFLSKWENQITIYEFSKLYERIQNNEITPAEVRQALIDLDANKQAKDKYNSVMHGLNIYLKTIISKR